MYSIINNLDIHKDYSKNIKEKAVQKIGNDYIIEKEDKAFLFRFSNKEDEQRFTANNLESNISHIISVYDLWYEFLFGSYKGSMFMIFCILISLLVDVAAFVFFYLIQK